MLSLIVHNDELSARLVRDQMHKVESEISNICSDILIILDKHLIPSTNVVESFVYYRKMKGDYHWYLAEFKAGDEKKDAADQSVKEYETASSRAEAELSPTNSVRLGVALNLSMFYCEIMNSPERAYNLAGRAFEDACTELQAHDGELHKDSRMVLDLLRDNCYLWSSYVQEGKMDYYRWCVAGKMDY